MTKRTQVRIRKFIREKSIAVARKITESASRVGRSVIQMAIDDFKAEANGYLTREFALVSNFVKLVEIAEESSDRTRIEDFAECITDVTLKEFCKRKAKEDAEDFMPIKKSNIDVTIAMLVAYEKGLLKAGQNGDDEGRGTQLVHCYMAELKEQLSRMLVKKFPGLTREVKEDLDESA